MGSFRDKNLIIEMLKIKLQICNDSSKSRITSRGDDTPTFFYREPKTIHFISFQFQGRKRNPNYIMIIVVYNTL